MAVNVIAVVSYYATLAEIQGAKVRTFGLDEKWRLIDFPERYSGKLLFLTSPASDYVTGQILYVDGGFTAK